MKSSRPEKTQEVDAKVGQSVSACRLLFIHGLVTSKETNLSVQRCKLGVIGAVNLNQSVYSLQVDLFVQMGTITLQLHRDPITAQRSKLSCSES